MDLAQFGLRRGRGSTTLSPGWSTPSSPPSLPSLTSSCICLFVLFKTLKNFDHHKTGDCWQTRCSGEPILRWFFPTAPNLRLIFDQRLTIGEFLRVELWEKRGLKIFSGMSEQEVEELPFQEVRPILFHYDHPCLCQVWLARGPLAGTRGIPIRSIPSAICHLPRWVDGSVFIWRVSCTQDGL